MAKNSSQWPSLFFSYMLSQNLPQAIQASQHKGHKVKASLNMPCAASRRSSHWIRKI